ncbi:MAG TPA: hypothetical protein RMH99_07770 [Sandaracinaceae bacterium LLY-WYZ-13_1]|nr:hypothetical protein [Sandaracinaceae bacterium LLY-WYZ-13_1]
MPRLTALTLSLALLAGCQVYDPALVEQDGGASGCDRSLPPPRPDAPDDGEDVGERVYVVRDVVFDQSGDRWRTIGYDLDERCTEPPGYDAECRPPHAPSRPEVDGEGGLDNAFGHHLFPLVEVTNPGLQDVARGYQERGVGAIMLIMRGWNGADDDARVEITLGISVYATPGGADDTEPPEVMSTPDGPQTPAGEPLPEPVWDGHDWFWLRADNFLDGDVDTPFIYDDNAYVSGGTIVLSLPNRTDFIFPGPEIGLLVRLTGAVATARLTDDGTRLEDIVVAGRWPTLDLLDTAEAVGVCPGGSEHEIFTRQLDRVSDIRAREGTGGPDVSCDAVSIGLAFEQGVEARFAGLAPGADVPNACEEEGM